MRFVRGLPMLLLFVPAIAAAQTMNAATFYQRSNKLMAKGPMALFSRGEINALMNEAERSIAASRTRRLADIAAGKPPRSCPPKGPQPMNSSEFMKRLGAIPAAERAKIDMTEAMTRITAARFPCPR